MSEKESNGLNRRQMMKNSAAGAMVAFVGSASGAAKQTAEITSAEEAVLLRDYRDATAIRQAVHEQSDLLEELSADGVIDSASVDDLYEVSEPSAGVGEKLTTYQVGDQFTPQIKVFRRTEAGYLSLSVFPEENRAHAVFNPVKNGEALGQDHLVEYGEMAKPGPEACWDGGQCQDCTCNYVCCSRDQSGDCVQYCNQCDCGCTCCSCSILCSSYC